MKHIFIIQLSQHERKYKTSKHDVLSLTNSHNYAPYTSIIPLVCYTHICTTIQRHFRGSLNIVTNWVFFRKKFIKKNKIGVQLPCLLKEMMEDNSSDNMLQYVIWNKKTITYFFKEFSYRVDELCIN